MNNQKTTKQPLRVIFLGSRPMSVIALNIIEKYIRQNDKNWIDLTVITNSDNRPPKGISCWWKTGTLEKSAKAKGLKVLKSFDQISYQSFDLGISVFSTDILPENVIAKARMGIVNFHFGYLPTVNYSFSKGSPHKKGEPFSKGTYRGSNVLSHAILNGENWQAVTLHFMSQKIDLGPVIEQRWNMISGTTTAWDLQLASEEKATMIFDKYFPILIDQPKSISIQAQGTSKYPYYSRQSLEDLKSLPKNIPAKKLDLVARALSFPNTEPPYFLEKDRKGFPVKRYVIYKKGKGILLLKPRRSTFIQQLKDII